MYRSQPLWTFSSFCNTLTWLVLLLASLGQVSPGHGQPASSVDLEDACPCLRHDADPEEKYIMELCSRMNLMASRVSDTPVVRDKWERIVVVGGQLIRQRHKLSFNVSDLPETDNITKAEVVVVTRGSFSNSCQPHFEQSRHGEQMTVSPASLGGIVGLPCPRPPTDVEVESGSFVFRSQTLSEEELEQAFFPPLSTLVVRWQLKHDFPPYSIGELKFVMSRFGRVVSARLLAKNCADIVYSDLVSARKAVTCPNMGRPICRVTCQWLYPSLAQPNVFAAVKNYPIHVKPSLKRNTLSK